MTLLVVSESAPRTNLQSATVLIRAESCIGRFGICVTSLVTRLQEGPRLGSAASIWPVFSRAWDILNFANPGSVQDPRAKGMTTLRKASVVTTS